LVRACREIGKRRDIASWLLAASIASLYSLGISWDVSLTSGIGNRFLVPVVPFVFMAVAELPGPWNRAIAVIALASVAWHIFGNSVGPEYMSSPAAVLRSLSTNGLSSFLLRNVSKRTEAPMPLLTTVVTVCYGAVSACLIWRLLRKKTPEAGR
jgi:hypothetical protein